MAAHETSILIPTERLGQQFVKGGSSLEFLQNFSVAANSHRKALKTAPSSTSIKTLLYNNSLLVCVLLTSEVNVVLYQAMT